MPPLIPAGRPSVPVSDNEGPDAAQHDGVAGRGSDPTDSWQSPAPSNEATRLIDQALEDSETLLEDESLPINPLTGLPMYTSGPVTATPVWSKRGSATPRRWVTIALMLGVLGSAVAIVVLAVLPYLPSSSSGPVEPDAAGSGEPTDPEPRDGLPVIRPQVAVLLEELALEITLEPSQPAELSSYWFTWTDPFGFEVTAGVDVASGNFTATTRPDTDIRRVDGRYYGRPPGGSWIELSGTAAESIPAPLIDGPLVVDDVVPPEVADYVVAEESLRYEQRALLIDDARLARERPVVRRAWLEPWGLLPDELVPEPGERQADLGVPIEAEPGDVRIVLRVHDDGVVKALSISSPSIGGSASYVLHEAQFAPLDVARPVD